MIIKLKYSYYIARPRDKKGRTKFRKEDRRTGILDFDTEIHWDDEDNYWNVVSDFLDEEQPKPVHALMVTAIQEGDK